MTAENELSCGRFLLANADVAQTFTPEDFSEEQRQIIDMTRRFAAESILPAIDRIEEKDFDLLRSLMIQAGELGLLSADTPEEFDGLEMGKVTSALITEWISVCASFTATLIAHSGIGLLPLLWYGTPEQKRRYLPAMLSGHTIAAYALSEGTSASDALNIRTSARLSEDGTHYVLNGEKMWISNAGLADIFTLFAKIDGDQFTAFLIERNTEGLKIGKEESKMGIRGSSTCPVVLRDCRVPVSNVLGVPGRGHHIAFNVLNAGRYKLGAMVLGGARYALQDAIAYAQQRQAFGQAISRFGLVQEKLAESAALLYVAESMVYRTVGAIDNSLSGLNSSRPDYADQVQQRIAKYAVECSIVKVWCTEMQAAIVDHVMQIFGGFGFTEEYPASRHYRDARITRIFEGTNEINRLIITRWTLKSIRDAIAALDKATEPYSSAGGLQADPLSDLTRLVSSMKRATLNSLSRALVKYPNGFESTQEIAGAFADMITEIYALESAVLRTKKNPSADKLDLTVYYAGIARRRFIASAEKIFDHVCPASGEMDVASLKTPASFADSITTGQRIASRVLTAS